MISHYVKAAGEEPIGLVADMAETPESAGGIVDAVTVVADAI